MPHSKRSTTHPGLTDRQVLDQWMQWPFHAIEIMACPGGCVGGGGQPWDGVGSKVGAERYKDDLESLYS